MFRGAIATATLSGNTINTTEFVAYGIYVALVPGFNSTINALSLTTNQIPQSGGNNLLVQNLGKTPFVRSLQAT